MKEKNIGALGRFHYYSYFDVYVGIEIASETIVANFLFRYILRFAQPHNNKPASPASQSAHTRARANSIGKWIRIIWLQVIAGCSDLMNHMNYINWSTCLWVLAHVLPHNSNAGKFQMKLKQTPDLIESLRSQYGYHSKQQNPMHLHNSMIISTEESPFELRMHLIAPRASCRANACFCWFNWQNEP